MVGSAGSCICSRKHHPSFRESGPKEDWTHTESPAHLHVFELRRSPHFGAGMFSLAPSSNWNRSVEAKDGRGH